MPTLDVLITLHADAAADIATCTLRFLRYAAIRFMPSHAFAADAATQARCRLDVAPAWFDTPLLPLRYAMPRMLLCHVYMIRHADVFSLPLRHLPLPHARLIDTPLISPIADVVIAADTPKSAPLLRRRHAYGASRHCAICARYMRT